MTDEQQRFRLDRTECFFLGVCVGAWVAVFCAVFVWGLI